MKRRYQTLAIAVLLAVGILTLAAGAISKVVRDLKGRKMIRGMSQTAHLYSTGR